MESPDAEQQTGSAPGSSTDEWARADIMEAPDPEQQTGSAPDSSWARADDDIMESPDAERQTGSAPDSSTAARADIVETQEEKENRENRESQQNTPNTFGERISAFEKREVHWLSHAGYYCVLFFAHWFGAARFDMDGDGDFDPEDVQKYLTQRGYLRNNLTPHSKHKAKKEPKEQKGPKEQDELDQQREEAQEEGAQMDDAPKTEPSGFSLDRNGDGKVDMDDLMESKVTGACEEDEIIANLMRRQNLPWFMMAECLVCFALWFVMAIVTSPKDFFRVRAGLDSFADDQTDLRLSTECEDQRFQVWRWLTYQWTHVGAMHVLMNVFMNIMLGVPLEGLHGSLRMALMFNVGVFGGACNHFVNDSHTVVVGCSGGVYALIGMHFADLAMNWSQKKFRMPTLVFILVLVGTDILTYSLGQSSETTSHSAHVGGFIAGICIGVLVGKNLHVKKWERVLQVVLTLFGLSLVLFCIIWLHLNKAPRNIWEAARGEEGYCWWRQVFNPEIEPDFVLCVRCGTQPCIDYWSAMDMVDLVSRVVCRNNGWFPNPI